jgi:hypothetical protein
LIFLNLYSISWFFFLGGKSTAPTSNERSGEKLFGPTYESSSKQNMNNKPDSLHLNVTADKPQHYRLTDTRRDEAVNTVDSTFRRLKKPFQLL